MTRPHYLDWTLPEVLIVLALVAAVTMAIYWLI